MTPLLQEFHRQKPILQLEIKKILHYHRSKIIRTRIQISEMRLSNCKMNLSSKRRNLKKLKISSQKTMKRLYRRLDQIWPSLKFMLTRSLSSFRSITIRDRRSLATFQKLQTKWGRWMIALRMWKI